MHTFCLRANNDINLSISFYSRGGEIKKEDKAVWVVCISSIKE